MGKGRLNSKQKGAEFERKVCQRLSLWVSNLIRKDVFWRSAMSGGRATLGTRKNRGANFSAQAGDISAIHEKGLVLRQLFVIECKYYKDIQLSNTIFGKKAWLGAIWEKLQKECLKAKCMPMLIAKQNNQPELLCVDVAGYEILMECGCNIEARVLFIELGCYIFHFSDVLTLVDFDLIRAGVVDGSIHVYS